MKTIPLVNPRFLIQRLTDATALRYIERFPKGLQIPTQGQTVIIGKTGGTVAQLAQIAHDYYDQLVFECRKTRPLNRADHERLRMLEKRSFDMLFLASSLAREYDPDLRRVNLHVGRTGEISSTSESSEWIPGSDHPTSSWASDLVSIFAGTSTIPGEITTKSPIEESGAFKIIPNDSRIQQLDALMKKIFERMLLDNDVASNNFNIECVPFGCRIHEYLSSIMCELILNTNLVPPNADIVSLGFNDGYITGKLIESESLL